MNKTPLPAVPTPPVPVIHDTDICGDCDDAAALAVLHRLADLGEARILAIVINGRDEDHAAGAAVSAINIYHGRPDIPLGGYHGTHTPLLKSQYTASIRDSFRIPLRTTTTCRRQSRFIAACWRRKKKAPW